MKNLDHYLENAIKNIAEDRKITRELLDDRDWETMLNVATIPIVLK